jgi:rSAM/selenodomain-associated transferase 1
VISRSGKGNTAPARWDEKTPGVIVFAREPIPGQTKTRLIARLGARNAAVLADAFLRDALCKASRVGPIIIAATSGGQANGAYFRRLARRFNADLIDQGSGSLGLRMERALEPYIARGAILIGTDTPSLPGELLARGSALLRRAKVVLGPSLDGGYYLIGVRGTLPPVFRGIRWSSSSVLKETVARLRRDHVRYLLAPTWYDVDRWGDLLLLIEHLRRMAASHLPSPCPATTRVLSRLFGDPRRAALLDHQTRAVKVR